MRERATKLTTVDVATLQRVIGGKAITSDPEPVTTDPLVLKKVQPPT